MGGGVGRRGGWEEGVVGGDVGRRGSGDVRDVICTSDRFHTNIVIIL